MENYISYAFILAGPPNVKSSRLLSEEEEKLLLSWLNFLHRAGVKISAKNALPMAGYIGRINGVVYHTADGTPTHGWWLRFKEKYQEVNKLNVENESKDIGIDASSKSKEMSKQDTDKRILEHVKAFVNETDGKNEEDKYYNIVMVPCRISEQGELLEFVAPSCIKHSVDQLMTLTVCTCADGMVLPSMITMVKGTAELEESICVETEFGDIDTKTFMQYMKHLDTFITKKRPAFIFVNGLQNLLESEVVEFCVERGIFLLSLPVPNVIQPSDIIPRILQAELEGLVGVDTDIPNIKVSELLERFKSASSKAQGEPMKAAFRQTGIFPFVATVLRSGSITKHTPNESKLNECCAAAKKALALQKR